MRGRVDRRVAAAVAAVGLMGLLLGPGCIQVYTKPARPTPRAKVEITIIVPAQPVPQVEETEAPPIVLTVPAQPTEQPQVCATSTPIVIAPTREAVERPTAEVECPTIPAVKPTCPQPVPTAKPTHAQPVPPVPSPDP